MVVGNVIIVLLILSEISPTTETAFARFSGPPASTGQGISSVILVIVVSVITYGLAAYFFVKSAYVTLASHAEYLAYLQSQYMADFIAEANSTTDTQSTR